MKRAVDAESSEGPPDCSDPIQGLPALGFYETTLHPPRKFLVALSAHENRVNVIIAQGEKSQVRRWKRPAPGRKEQDPSVSSKEARNEMKRKHMRRGDRSGVDSSLSLTRCGAPSLWSGPICR